MLATEDASSDDEIRAELEEHLVQPQGQQEEEDDDDEELEEEEEEEEDEESATYAHRLLARTDAVRNFLLRDSLERDPGAPAEIWQALCFERTLWGVEGGLTGWLGLHSEVVEDGVSPQLQAGYLQQLARLLHWAGARDSGRFMSLRRTLVRCYCNIGIVDAAVRALESYHPITLEPASGLLADIMFKSDEGASAVLQGLDRITAALREVLVLPTDINDRMPFFNQLEAMILLLLNLAGMTKASHQALLPLVSPLCSRIFAESWAVDLRSHLVTLLANLSLTCRDDLRALGVGRTLLEMVMRAHGSIYSLNAGADNEANEEEWASLGPAESVIVYLHGHERCAEIDALVERDFIRNYCHPLLTQTLDQGPFRGMLPFLTYTSRVFAILATTREYAKALHWAENHLILLDLIAACKEQSNFQSMESNVEGRVWCLHALGSLASWNLLPTSEDWEAPVWARGGASEGPETPEMQVVWEAEHTLRARRRVLCAEFVEAIPNFMKEDRLSVRTAASRLWALTNKTYVYDLFIIGRRLEDQRMVHMGTWRNEVLSFLYPFLAQQARPDKPL